MQSTHLLVEEAEALRVHPLRSARRTSADRARRDVGITVTEMLVALMVLSVGALGSYHLFATAAATTATAASRVTAQQLTSAELEAIRALPYRSVSMTSSNVDPAMFDSHELVGPTSESRVDPMSVVNRNGIDFTVWRKVGWAPVSVDGVTTSRTMKLVTVVVTWTDRGGLQERRLSSAVTGAQTNE